MKLFTERQVVVWLFQHRRQMRCNVAAAYCLS